MDSVKEMKIAITTAENDINRRIVQLEKEIGHRVGQVSSKLNIDGTHTVQIMADVFDGFKPPSNIVRSL